jgi:hypothetical protein
MLRVYALAVLVISGAGCTHDPEPTRAASSARTENADPTGVIAGLRNIAAERNAVLAVRDCAMVDNTRVVICEADLSATEVVALRDKLVLGPLGQTKAPGPPFGESRCLDRAPAGAIALVTGFPWIARSHFRYLLVVVPPGGGRACVETEHGYS